MSNKKITKSSSSDDEDKKDLNYKPSSKITLGKLFSRNRTRLNKRDKELSSHSEESEGDDQVNIQTGACGGKTLSFVQTLPEFDNSIHTTREVSKEGLEE